MIKNGIERQTLAVAMIPILILALLMEGFFTYTRFKDLDQALLERSTLIAGQLASASEYPVFSGNLELLQQQVHIASSQKDVVSVIVLDANSTVLTVAGDTRRLYDPNTRSVLTKELAPYYEDHHYLRLQQQIVPTQIKLDELGSKGPSAEVKPLGSVIIEVSKHHLNVQKTEMLVLNLLLTLSILLTTLFISLRVSRRITWPVLEMSKAIRRIGEGDMDTRIAVAKVSELNALGHGINEMAHQLQQDRNTMQQRIAEATLELRHKKEDAERANFDKSRFLAAASHDLRQPMHALGLFVGELHSRLDTPEQRKIVHKVEESVEALSSLLDSLLDISKLDAGIVIPQVREFDIDSLMLRLLHEIEPITQRKNIKLHMHTMAFRLSSDPVLLERILLNLLGNAVRYTPVDGTILFACRKRGDSLLIEVRDNGIGIPAEEHKNIFHEFVQLENTARDRSKGLGLGLAIVDRLAKLLNHPLSIRSELGRGSNFSILIPCASGVDKMADEDFATTTEVSKQDKMEGLRVLVVDDDTLVRTSTGGILASWGCRVTLAENVQAVIDRHLEACFDLVVCDYRLPDGSGLELADRFNECCDQLPHFILISGDTAPEVLQAVNERQHHLLHKPVRPAKLRSLIVFLLKNRSGRE